MWPFRKKEKKTFITTAQLLDIKSRLGDSKPTYKCPDPACLCFTCPSRGKCSIEKDVRMSGACVMADGLRVRECSWNKNLRGEFNAKKEDTDGRRTTPTSGNGGSIQEVLKRGGR